MTFLFQTNKALKINLIHEEERKNGEAGNEGNKNIDEGGEQ